MKKGLGKRMLSMLLATSMVAGTTVAATGCKFGSNSNEPITLTVYSQVANSSGLQKGWAADLIKDKFNVKLNIVPDESGTFQTRMSDKDLGDIIIWGHTDDNYAAALKAGLLYDLEEDDILKENAPYVYDNMQDALAKNKRLSATILGDGNDKLYGWGGEVATSSKDHQSFFYTWDTRWDLYKKMGYPKVKNMSDMADLLKKMQKMDPKDDAGGKTYAVSLWPDWDDAMVMYVKATATAYYGYDELGIGLYDPTTGKYHDALEENGPYLEML